MRRGRGRPPKDSQRTNVYLENEIIGQLQIFILHPVTGRLRHGALSSIINNLLRQFVTQLKKPGVDPVKVLEAYGVDLSSEEKDVKHGNDSA